MFQCEGCFRICRQITRAARDSTILNITTVHRLINMQDEKPRSSPARSGITPRYVLAL
jgi:hypothetical protein